MDGRRKRRFRALYGGIPSRNGIALFKDVDIEHQRGEENGDNVNEEKKYLRRQKSSVASKKIYGKRKKKHDDFYF